MPHVWAGPQAYAGDPVLVLPNWLGPRELDIIEQTTGGRIVEVPDTGLVRVSRADGEGGWIDLGYADNFELEQADQFRYKFDRSLGELLVRKTTIELDVPFELMQDWAAGYRWKTSRPADWTELWTRHMLNGPAALVAGGWRREWVGWSQSAVWGLVGDKVNRWGIDRLQRWSVDRVFQVPVPFLPDPFEDCVSDRMEQWRKAWSEAFESAYRLGPGPAGYTDPPRGGTVSVEQTDRVLQRSWESDYGPGTAERERQTRQGQTTWDEDWFDG